ncbi:ATP-dependent DNA helicase MER3 [Cladophialophora chaetospira]|uniref:DNA 3'-5' helicase n=1 Tax=Cladophialophora chaetospira TaxID=386627 RepID=A0AA38XJ94_9EURO|nr:ATP-dependent DNA helicase MER3 [Cladophialophora chaetospira]
MLAETWSSTHPMQRLWNGPNSPLALHSPELKAIAPTGVAFHHGGLSLEDRRAVEQAFLQGQINIICSTSTLAVGVNLPCYLVILKGTCTWTDTGFKELADLEVMQMLGRAGRPQFETSACAVILCRKEKVSRYEKMVSGEELLESCLHQNLIEHLNAEIVLGTVQDVPTAKQWLASTFLYVRLKKNPAHYQLREGVEEDTDEDLLEALCRKDIDLLLDAGIVEEKSHLVSTMFGEAMARYCVSFETMKFFIALPPRAKMSELLSLLAQARDFREVRMQAGEKSFYKEINKAPEIKFPIKVDIALPAHKISLLMQAEMGNVALPDGENHKKHHQQYRIDRSYVFMHANRLVRCLIDCQIQLQDATSARHALELGRSLAAHVWDNTASQLRQVDGLGEVAVRKLAAASINSIDALLNTEPSRIELVLGKNPPFGHQLLKKLESFPNLRVSVKETKRDIRDGKGVSIQLIAEIGFLNEVSPQRFGKKAFSVCFLAEDSHGKLIDFRRFGPKKLEHGEQVHLTLHLTKPTGYVNFYVMCDDIAGTSKYAELKLSDIPASIYPVTPAKDDLPGVNGKRNHDVTTDTNFDDDFDDGGIDDLDLLAADADGSRIEVIEDIDAVLETEERTKVNDPTNQSGEDADAPAYREPTQLPNGRWTCQHDCNDRNKQCKHKCCHEGASRPKRRLKLESKVKEEEKGQTKLTDMASIQPHVKNGQKPKSKTETKVQTKFPDAPTTKPKDSQPRKRARSLEGQHRARSRSGSFTSMPNHKAHTDHPTGKRSRLSKDRTSDFWGEEPDIGGLDSESESALPWKSLRQTQLKQPASKVTAAEDDGFLSYDEDDFFDFSLAESGTLNIQPSVAGEQDLIQDTPGLGESRVSEKDLIALDEDNFDFLTSDIDLGGFEPPIEHVAMSDVLKKDRSIADAQSSTAVESSDLRDEMHFDAGSTGASSDFIEVPANQKQHAEDVSIVPDFVNSNANTPAESPVKTPGEDELEGTGQDVLGAIVDVYANETEGERKKRQYEEDQKKKWEGIDQWLYDEFHEYVELV